MSVDLKLVPGVASDAEVPSALERCLRQMAHQKPADEMPRQLHELGTRVVLESMRRETTRRGLRRFALGALAAAAGTMLWLHTHRQPVLVEVPSSSVQLTRSVGGVEVAFLEEKLNAKERVWSPVAATGKFERGFALRTALLSVAEISLDEAVRVSLSEKTEITWPWAGKGQVELAYGSAAFAVHLVPGEKSFVVVAGQHKVAVRGAVLSVTVLEEGAAACVVVSEGIAEVTGPVGTVLVHAGKDFGCSRVSQRSESQDAKGNSASDSLDRLRQKMVGGSSKQAPKVTQEVSGLAEQNELFRQALLAERADDVAEAKRLLDAFLVRYPTSPLASQVRSQRAALIARSE